MTVTTLPTLPARPEFVDERRVAYTSDAGDLMLVWRELEEIDEASAVGYPLVRWVPHCVVRVTDRRRKRVSRALERFRAGGAPHEVGGNLGEMGIEHKVVR